MNIIKPFVNVVDFNEHEMLRGIETKARTCYRSEGNIKVNSASNMCARLVEAGHEAMIEHASISVMFRTDRGVSHEIVRHRMASYAQESTRYCNYSKDKFNSNIDFIIPMGLVGSQVATMIQGYGQAELHYMSLIRDEVSPQIARSVLPNGLATSIWVTANLREWRHIFKLRTDVAAHPEIRRVMIPLCSAFADKLPSIFGNISVAMRTDIPEEYLAGVNFI